jgi:NAD(P)-dependent dehydrogenase (short-subunit alcohol dehydrogenase family)
MMGNLNKFCLDEKVALITGSAGLLGVQHAVALLDCGASVIITDVDENALENIKTQFNKKDYDRIYVKKMDVTDKSSIEQVLDFAVKEFGGVHILVNNAAIDPKVDAKNKLIEASRFETFSLEQWNFQLNVGLTGAFLCSQVFGKWMAEHDGGAILNIASDLSVIAPDQRLYRQEKLSTAMQPVKPVTYSVIKTGLIGLTRYLATYWAYKRVRVNALSPGGVYTDQPAAFVKRLSDLIPMGRMANVDEYRSAVQFLCSDASSYMTGQNIVIDGGRSVW